MSIVLIGYRGSGKTTVGRALAGRLGSGFVDTDEWVVRRAGRSIRDIFADQGEGAFRDLESAVVREAAVLHGHVVALGGGALGREENRMALREKGHKVVYLRCEPEELLRRIRSDPATAANRPNLTHLAGGIEEIRALLAVREPSLARRDARGTRRHPPHPGRRGGGHPATLLTPLSRKPDGRGRAPCLTSPT